MKVQNIIAGLVTDIAVKEAYQSTEKYEPQVGSRGQLWTVVYMDGTANTFKNVGGRLKPIYAASDLTPDSLQIRNYLSPLYFDVKRVK